ncbi:thioesterase [Iodidimonas gelatinilytica]|uniref:Thioesterase n=1 Tax=Iodidimonas gelatinilytica TaxID=1236966 RepID=A0A5A7MNW7_9PROT|nr:PaaI family thioesterase [Iodidimonas gelatinilytica]GEQ97334.1 thioesterase [Iodidimonas gelatinilytica]
MTPEVFAALKEKSAQEVSLAAIPYAGFMGMFLQRNVDDMLVHLKYDIKHIGAPGRYHGGVVGATLEFAAMAQVMWAAYLKGEPVARDSLPKPVTVTVDFLRSAGLCDLYASALIVRQGRRIASVRASAWQEDRQKPVAEAQMHFLVS